MQVQLCFSFFSPNVIYLMCASNKSKEKKSVSPFHTVSFSLCSHVHSRTDMLIKLIGELGNLPALGDTCLGTFV